MTDRTARLLKALAAVPEEGTLDPAWESTSRSGAVYRGTGSALEDDALAGDLEYLAERDYLERVFVERLSLCGSCGSHAVNVHEACTSCSSSNLVQFKALLHFRCGFVGPTTAYRQEPGGLRCPKCNRLLKDLGTDHDSPGEYFRCLTCTSMFQVPDVGARCLSCGARFSGSGMQEIGHRDVHAYRRTSLGKAALAENRLLEDSAPAAPSANGLARRTAMIEAIEDARRNRIASGKNFALLVIRCGENGSAVSEDDVASRVRSTVAREFQLGRLDSAHMVMLVPGASSSLARSLTGQLANGKNGDLKAQVVELSDGEAVSDALEIAARQIDAHG